MEHEFSCLRLFLGQGRAFALCLANLITQFRARDDSRNERSNPFMAQKSRERAERSEQALAAVRSAEPEKDNKQRAVQVPQVAVGPLAGRAKSGWCVPKSCGMRHEATDASPASAEMMSETEPMISHEALHLCFGRRRRSHSLSLPDKGGLERAIHLCRT